MKRGFMLVVLMLLLSHHALFAHPIKLVIWHSLAGHLGKEFKQITTLFNESQTNYEIKPIYKGEYTDALTAFAAAFRANKPPAIVQIFEVGTATMLAPKGIIKPLHELMQEQNLTLQTKDFLESVKTYYSENGQLQALPFNISIPLIYYNADALAKVGVNQDNFPTTWDDLEKLLYQLKQNGYACGYTSAYPSWIHIEVFSALHGLPFINQNQKTASYNNSAILHHLIRLRHWQKRHYFEYGGRRNESTILFTSGRCAIFSQSSGAYASLNQLVQFKLGVAKLPLEQKVSTVRHGVSAGGGALWAVSGQSLDAYRGIAQFYVFLTNPLIQQQWHNNTGYIPLVFSKTTNTLLSLADSELNNPTSEYVGFYRGPLNQIRSLNDEALEAIFSNLKSTKKALNEAVTRANFLLLRSSRNVLAGCRIIKRGSTHA